MSFVSEPFLPLFSQTIILWNTRKLKHKANLPVDLQLISEKKGRTSWFTATGSLRLPHSSPGREHRWMRPICLLLGDWNQLCLKAQRGCCRPKGKRCRFRESGGHPEKLDSPHKGTGWKWDVFKKSLNKFMEICKRWREIPSLPTHSHGQACLSEPVSEGSCWKQTGPTQCGARKSLFTKAI